MRDERRKDAGRGEGEKRRRGDVLLFSFSPRLRVAASLASLIPHPSSLC
jgi:hypothetical protein